MPAGGSGWHSGKSSSLTSSMYPRLCGVAHDFKRRFEHGLVIQSADQDNDDTGVAFAFVHHSGTAIRAELPANDPTRIAGQVK